MMSTRRGQPHPVILATQQLASTLAATQVTIQGKVQDTDQIEALVFQFTLTLQSSNVSQQTFFINDPAQRDLLIDNLFGGPNAYKLQIQSPNLGQIISSDIKPSELFRAVAAVFEVYPEGPLVDALGVGPTNGLGLAAATGKIENTVLTLTVPFAAAKKAAFGNLFCPLGKQFKGGGIEFNAPIIGTAFTDSAGNTWAFGTGAEAPRVKISAICRPSGASDGLVSPMRFVCNKSSERMPTLSGDFMGLGIYLGTANNVAYGLDQAANNGQFGIRVDGLEIVSPTDSSPDWSKRSHLASLYDPSAYMARNVLQQPGSGTGTVISGQTLMSADITSTPDMPLIFMECGAGFSYATVCADKYTFQLNDQWLTQTPVVKFIGVVVWPLTRIGTTGCGCAPSSTTPGLVVGPPDKSDVPAPIAENFLPRFTPAA